MHLSYEGLKLIMRFEGFEPDWYKCEAGVDTIGFGHTGPLPSGFTAPLSQAEAMRLLQYDVMPRLLAMQDSICVPLSQPQTNALCSFIYNVGIEAFRTSTLLRRLNAGLYEEAADEMLRWVFADGKVSDGLVYRRRAERALFLSEDPGEWMEKAKQMPLKRLVPQPPIEV